ncbi:MAG: DNA polymerase III subunit delta' [Thiohalocapsa sp.]|jgi:DNA polymerase-3 subunit delta'
MTDNTADPDRMPRFEPLPWLEPHRRRLWQSFEQGRLAHALLLTGPAGVGKRHFADLFTAALMCRARRPGGLPCGDCADCTLLRAGNHPDTAVLQPDAEAKTAEIKVEAVRELCGRQTLTAQRGPRSVLRIAPAEAMNAHAANSLLKTLEEPADSTLLILISESPTRLAATITSRCQRLSVPSPDAATASEWLAARMGEGADVGLLLRLAHGAPLRALDLADAQWLKQRDAAFRHFLLVASGSEDPLLAAAAWQQQEVPLLLEWLTGWVTDLLRIASAGDGAHLGSPDKRAELARLVSRTPPIAGHRFLQRLLQARAVASSTVNRQLLLESLAIGWARVSAGERCVAE